MKPIVLLLYSVGGACLLLGLMNGVIGDVSAGCESPILGTCLVLSGNAAVLAKAGSVLVIAGWFVELVRLSKELVRK